MKKIYQILLFIVFFSANEFVYASTPYNNKTAFSVGVDYPDGTSSVTHANNSYNAYNSMGLTTKKITSTTASNMLGTHSNGTKYLESGIVYLVGHSTFLNVDFINGVCIDNSLYTSGPSIGIRSFNNSKTALIIFAGCKTALQSENNNITKLTYESGAAISMGWKTDLNISSYVNWNNRFNNKIKDKTTSVLSAAQSASNHIYLSNTVKNYKIYGGYNNNPWYYMTHALIANSSNFEITEGTFSNCDYCNIEEINKYLKSNVNNIDLRNYKLEINGVHEKYYDFVLYADDVRTNLGYTVVLEQNSNKMRFINNMNGYDYFKIVNKIKSINVKSIDVLKIEKNFINGLDPKFNKIEIVNKTKFFDYESEKLYYVIEYKIINNNNHVLTSYLEEIK